MRFIRSDYCYERGWLLFLCAAIAIALHLGLLFGLRFTPKSIQVFGGEEGLVEVSLVEAPLQSPQTAESLESNPSAPEPESPKTVLQPATEKIIDEVPLAEQPAPAATPQETVQLPPAPRPPDKRRSISARESRSALSQKKSALMPAGVARADSSESDKSSSKKIAKPAFVTRPSVSYPQESRVAGEEGIVTLRITVDSRGRPSNVIVLVSSRFPRLDRAAVEGGWRCRIRNAESGAQFDAPMRFDLRY